jgi:putative CocE/NonD family hydrolase
MFGLRATPLVVLGLAATLAAQDPAPWVREIVVERNLPVRMRDGVTLYADVYRPKEPGSFPALLLRTPYDKEGPTQSGRLALTIAAVRRGYVVVAQDTRGQFKSEGRFLPYAQEVNDGHDSIEWVATLPYVNGKVGTFGLSYPGAVQWMTAPTRPPHLTAMVPAMTFASHRHFVYDGGVFNTGFLNWMLGRQFRERLQLGLSPSSGEQLRDVWPRQGDEWMSYLPVRDLPVMKPFAYWAEWTDHPIESPYWRAFDIEAQHDRVTVPALNFSGWNDDAYGQPGAIRNFVGMRARGGSDLARKGQRLIIGPWTHGVPTLTRTGFRGVDYGPNAGIDFNEPQLRFFDYWLKGIDNGYSSEPPVRLFVMGDNVWRDEREWPLARTQHTDLFLRTGGRLAFAAATDDAPARFVYDPRKSVRLPPMDASGDRDWSALRSREDVLTYTTEPLDRATELTGHLVAHLWISSTAQDTDFTGRAFDVDPTGRAWPLTAAPGVLRARYRSTEDPVTPRPLTPGNPTELTISLGYTSYVIKPGHRLQVLIMGSVFPDVHLNIWGPFTAMSQAIPATQTVYHDRAHPSRIQLPLIPRGAGSARLAEASSQVARR